MLENLQSLDVEARPVRIVFRGPLASESLEDELARKPSWLSVEFLRDPLGLVPRAELYGSSPHGPIAFEGALEGLLLDPFLVALSALGMGKIDWTSDEAPRLLAELERSVELEILVSASCPFCATAAEAAVRFAAASARVATTVRRVDLSGLPEGAHQVPTARADGIIVAEGAVDEAHLLRQILVYQRSQAGQSGVTCVSPSERGQPVPRPGLRSGPPGPRATRRPRRSTAA